MSNYTLVESHVDYVRRMIRETSDDSYFTNEEIYKTLIDARALVLSRKFKKGKTVPDYFYMTICVPLCEDVYHDCDCVPEELGCKVLKTKYEIPKVFYNETRELSRVATLNGEEIAPSTDAKRRYRSYKKTRLDALYYTRTNNKLAIFNSPQNRLRAITIKAIFEDPIAASTISLCDPSGQGCIDIESIGFSTETSDNLDIYNIVLQMLNVVKQAPEDRSNDADSNLDQSKT